MVLLLYAQYVAILDITCQVATRIQREGRRKMHIYAYFNCLAILDIKSQVHYLAMHISTAVVTTR
jgi:hypothetical protein